MNEHHIWMQARSRGLPEGAWLLIVDTAAQQLAAWLNGARRGRFRVSTSRNGLGCEEGSERTPGGWHEVADRIGHGAPPGRLFERREPRSRVLPPSQWTDDAAGDVILSRILRLRGMEPGVNAGQRCDTYDRLIYIHGTAQEHRLGTPASHGCIRMGNREVISLFELIGSTPAWCWIGPLATRPPE